MRLNIMNSCTVDIIWGSLSYGKNRIYQMFLTWWSCLGYPNWKKSEWFNCLSRQRPGVKIPFLAWNTKGLTNNFLSSLFLVFPTRKIFCSRLDWTPWVFLPAQDLLNKQGLKWSVFPFPTSCNRRMGRMRLSYKWSHLPKPQNKQKHRKWRNRNPHLVA